MAPSYKHKNHGGHGVRRLNYLLNLIGKLLIEESDNIRAKTLPSQEHCCNNSTRERCQRVWKKP